MHINRWISKVVVERNFNGYFLKVLFNVIWKDNLKRVICKGIKPYNIGIWESLRNDGEPRGTWLGNQMGASSIAPPLVPE